MLIEPGTATISFSITSTRPKRCSSAAIWLARWLPGFWPPGCGLPGFGPAGWNVARSWAVPKPAPAGGGVLVATAAPTTVAASATTISARTSVCCRHSRRNIRHAQRITARRAGTPPFPAPACTLWSSSGVLIVPAPA